MTNALRRAMARRWVKKRTKLLKNEILNESKIDGLKDPEEVANSLIHCGSDNRGNSLYLRLNHRKFEKVEVILFLDLSNGRTYELPNLPNATFDKLSDDEWSIGDLRLKILEKSRRIRVTYNGFMRRDNNIEYVRFNFIFIAKTRPRARKDYWDPELASNALAKTLGSSTEWQRLWDCMRIDGVDQWGSMVGQVFTEDGIIMDLFLHGFRCHLYDTFDQNIELKKSLSLTGFTAKGLNFHIIVNNYDNGPQKMFRILLGHIKDGNDDFKNIKRLELNKFEELDLVNVDSEQFLIKFTAEERDYEVNLKLNKSSYKKSNDSKHEYISVDLDFNGREGRGMIEIWKPKSQNSMAPLKNKLTIEYSTTDSEMLISRFDDELYKTEELIGGKGLSLVKLHSLKSNQFSVPKGFCITATAFKKHIEENKCLQDGIDELFLMCTSLNGEKIEASCQKLVHLFEKTTLTKKLEEEILENLVVGERYAVRSSAVGEDGPDSSSAGQNATFLGIRGVDEVLLSVAKCWGSLYSYRSVEYRRQQGLPIKSTMGVCVQEMVDSDSAGVMFTRHPSTGNPKELIITSNYGLGETVVSASVEPDTIIVSRDWQDMLQIKQVNIGLKGQTLKMDTSQGIATTKTTGADNKIQSISNSHALELAKIGIYLEKVLDGSKDVEWAISGGKIHLLQCRPITSLNNFTEFELTHELGTGTATDADAYHLANVGETFPYAMSPLTLSTMVKSLEATMEYFMTGKINFNKYKRYLFIGYMRLQMNYISLCRMAPKNKKIIKLNDIAMIGRVMTTDEILQLGRERHGPLKKMEAMRMMMTMTRGFFNIKKIIKKSKQLIRICERKFARDPKTAKELTARQLYKKLEDNVMDVVTSNRYHNIVTTKSIMLQILVMNLVTEGSEDITEEHFVDIAHLLKSCRDVINARVPTIMRNIAKTIREDNLVDEFKSVNSLKLDWLRKNCPRAHEKVDKFLSVYGHRAVMEWDLMTETWGMNPDKLLSTVQVLASADLEVDDSLLEEPMDVNKIVDELISPKKARTKWLLRKLLPKCHKTLQRRELTKSLLMKVVHIFRTNYIRLETLMIKEGLLPDHCLIFFLTHEEIGMVLDGGGTEFVRRAIQRRRHYPKLRSYQFNEINFGMLEPIKIDKEDLSVGSGPLIQGTAVCGGEVTGRACVITHIDDAKEIRPGDVLITKSTDIGWTPYFSILFGVVTEIGGIISHGSVVAREFNLPCIIGATNATKVFKTGDLVTLNGNTGILKLI